MKAEESAWAAGFYEGEGSATMIVKRGRWAYLRLRCTQVNRDPLERMKALYGGSISPIRSKNPNAKQAYVWSLEGHRAEKVIETMWRHLSEKRRVQIERVLTRVREYAINLQATVPGSEGW